MALLTDREIRETLGGGEIEIDPFEERQLQPASYDLRLGHRAIISRTVSLEELKGKVVREEVREMDVEKERSIRIPGGAFALVATLERIRLSSAYAAHIGMRTYYVRKGLMLLSGLQIDPGWDGVLVLGLANLSPRGIVLEFNDHLCTIEVHRLDLKPDKVYAGPYMAEQREGRIPTADKDYLRTIETMSVSDLTHALIELSASVDILSKQVRLIWFPVGIAAFGAILAAAFSAIFR